MYLHARQWGIQPSEFWEMTLKEWYCEYELHAKMLENARLPGRLTTDLVEDLEDDLKLTPEQFRAKHGARNG